MKDNFSKTPKTTTTKFNGRNITWKGEGYYRFSTAKNTYVYVNPSSVKGFELAGVKVICISARDIK